MKRRKFIRTSAIASTSTLIPTFLQSCGASKEKSKSVGSIKSNTNNTASRKLIVIQLSGGNDGLNTFIPYRNDIYYRNRPKIHIPKREVLPTTDTVGLHPALQGLDQLFDKNLISVINAVGYPNSTRSHFRAMDVWHSGFTATKKMSYGWIGRYLDYNCNDNLAAVEIDDTLSLALKGEKLNGFSLSDISKLRNALASEGMTKSLQEKSKQRTNSKVDFLYKTLATTQESADYLFDKTKAYKSTVNYPGTPLGRDLKLIAQLITSDLPTKIYYASLSGFDTHARQKNKHQKLLSNLSDSVAALVQDLRNHKVLDDTLVMVFSEFGRRVAENGSMGTDHGKGNNLMLLGSKLAKPGFFNEMPSLKTLDGGDVQFDIDFRRVYASILDNWLGVDSKTILSEKYEHLNIFS